MASQTSVSVVGAWVKDDLLEEDLAVLDLVARLAEGVWGGREDGSTLAAREEPARVVTILGVLFDLVVGGELSGRGGGETYHEF
jgi:hypothetical protein